MSAPTSADFARLIDLGLRPHWLYPPTSGKSATGKRPIEYGWSQQPYSLVTQQPCCVNANLGLRTGLVEGAPLSVVVVDFDSERAVDWARTALPVTPMRTKTQHGEHWYYRYPALKADQKINNKCRFTLADGTKLEVDIRADQGNVVVAPSIHYSGHVYTEIEPWDQIIPEQIPLYDPEWLSDGRKLTATSGRPKGTTQLSSSLSKEDQAAIESGLSLLEDMPAEPPTERPGLLPEHFQAQIYAGCKRELGGKEALEALNAIVLGDVYAPAGSRNNALFQATRLIAEWCPLATDDQIEAFITPSLIKTGDKGANEELRNWRDVLARSREKWAQRDHWIIRAEKKGACVITPDLISGAGDMRSRLILTFANGNHVVLQRDGTYGPKAFASVALEPYIEQSDILGWAQDAQLAHLAGVDAKGRYKRRALKDILATNGRLIKSEEGSFSISQSEVKGSHFLEEVAPKRRGLMPVYNEQIAQWLHMFAGDDHDRLLDWLAGFRDLLSPAPVLILIGAPAAGKNLLVNGLARMWARQGPTRFEHIFESFNDGLQSCPLLFGDELVDMGKRKLEEHLRQLTTARSHTLRRKFRDSMNVSGCLRMILGFNEEPFSFGSMNEYSKKALAERLLHVRVSVSAASYLMSLPSGMTSEWVDNCGIIKHVYWLAENRIIKRGRRLIVDGNGEYLINLSQNKQGPGADLALWICRYVEDIADKKARGLVPTRNPGLILENGELWVSVDHTFSGGENVWKMYVKYSRSELPPMSVLRQAINSLSQGNKQARKVPGSGKRAFYHQIQLAQFYTWAEQHDLDVDTVRAVVESTREVADLNKESNHDKERNGDAGVRKDFTTLTSMRSLNDVLGDEHSVNTSGGGDLGARDCDDVQPSASKEGAEYSASEAGAQKPSAPVKSIKPRNPRVVALKSPKEKPRVVRTAEYFTPEICPWGDELYAALPSTEAEAVVFFAPKLSAAMNGHPSTFARLTYAYRAYRFALRQGTGLRTAAELAIETYKDRGMQPAFLAMSRLSHAAPSTTRGAACL